LLKGEEVEGWKELVGAWRRLEESYGYASSTKSHPTTNRPKEVGVWVKNARKGTPAIADVEDFAKRWWVWWKGINPTWRLRDGDLVRDSSGSWDVLRCPGQNGFLNVVICLKWWHEVDEVGAPSEEWTHAVSDVKWVLDR
ncbi:hypothetical protein B0H16DRAFT_1254351, partial [Mycena metata]